MSIRRIEKLESDIVLHAKRLDDHDRLIAALENNTKVTTHLTTVMGNLIEALSWATKASIWAIKISKAIMWITGGIGILYFGTKTIIAKFMGYL